MNEYEVMRNEIKRLHDVCRAKDQNTKNVESNLQKAIDDLLIQKEEAAKDTRKLYKAMKTAIYALFESRL